MYAKDTKVDPSKSREEIERLLIKQKAHKVGVGMDLGAGRATVFFAIKPMAAKGQVVPDRTVSFVVSMPKREEFKSARYGYLKTEGKVDEDWQKAVRQRWRSLLMVLKGKFAAIETGVETFEQAFFYHLQVPSGGTVGEHVEKRYQQALNNPTAPLLGAGT